MEFASREDAGQKLGAFLKERGFRPDIVLGLPRGGVVVAAEVAKILEAPLDVLIVRKIGHPLHREFAVGALAEGGVVLLDDRAIRDNRVVRSELENIIAEESDRLHDYEVKFHPTPPRPLQNSTVLLVDDGLATGATTEAAALSAKRHHAKTVIVAAPVGSIAGFQRLRRVADEVLVLFIDRDFDAVGRYYDVFEQTTDEQVLQLLKAA